MDRDFEHSFGEWEFEYGGYDVEIGGGCNVWDCVTTISCVWCGG